MREERQHTYGADVSGEYPDVKISIERITPSVAEKMLEANRHNRSPKRSTIGKAMARGEWQLNGETIVFASDGTLIDGQNRLIAMAKSGKPHDTIVVRGVEKRAQLTIDVGSKRRLSDYLQMNGYKASKSVAAIGIALMHADEFGIDSCFMTSKQDARTLIEAYDYTTAVYESRIAPILQQTVATARLFKLRTGLFAPLFDAFRRIGEDDFVEFANELRGISAQCQPVQKLSQVLLLNRDDKKSSLAMKTVAAYTVKAWNSFMQGEEIPFLRFVLGGAHPEAFPEIFGHELLDGDAA